MSTATFTPTLEQERAAHALTCIREVDGTTFATEYRSYVEGLPATIVMNGLGQACATLLAGGNGKGEREHAYQKLHSHLQSWLCRTGGGVYAGSNSLIDAIVKHRHGEYVHAQAEALAYLVWLKKFAQAFLPRRS